MEKERVFKFVWRNNTYSMAKRPDCVFRTIKDTPHKYSDDIKVCKDKINLDNIDVIQTENNYNTLEPVWDSTHERINFLSEEDQLPRIDTYSSSKTTLQLLEEYDPSPDEIDFKKEMLEFIKTPTAFERSNLDGHFTGSAWVCTLDGNRALITHHKKLKKKLQLGGHADGDTDILRVAIKEALEESGIRRIGFIPSIFDIDIHIIPAKGDPDSDSYTPEHKHYDVRFLIVVDNDSEYHISDESDKLEWIDNNFNCEGTGSNFRRLFDKWSKTNFFSDGFRDMIHSF